MRSHFFRAFSCNRFFAGFWAIGYRLMVVAYFIRFSCYQIWPNACLLQLYISEVSIAFITKSHKLNNTSSNVVQKDGWNDRKRAQLRKTMHKTQKKNINNDVQTLLIKIYLLFTIFISHYNSKTCLFWAKTITEKLSVSRIFPLFPLKKRIHNLNLVSSTGIVKLNLISTTSSYNLVQIKL